MWLCGQEEWGKKANVWGDYAAFIFLIMRV